MLYSESRRRGPPIGIVLRWTDQHVVRNRTPLPEVAGLEAAAIDVRASSEHDSSANDSAPNEVRACDSRVRTDPRARPKTNTFESGSNITPCIVKCFFPGPCEICEHGSDTHSRSTIDSFFAVSVLMLTRVQAAATTSTTAKA